LSDDLLRVLVVDDTVTYRKILGDVLAEIPGVTVVGVASNGKIALQKVEQLRPDVLTLDLEMPEMDGLEVLRRLRAAKADVGAIMLSAFTVEGAQATLAALDAGAFDFVVKPSGNSVEANTTRLRRELQSKLAAFARRRDVHQILSGTTPSSVRPSPSGPASRPTSAGSRPAALDFHLSPSFSAAGPVEAVVLGISTGGPKALTEMLPRLPGDFPVPILIVQHMPPVFTRSLAEDLNVRCKLHVTEAEDGQAVLPGHILIAPGGRQMGLRRDGDKVLIRITDDPPENSCRPAVDYLFRAAAEVFGGATLAVIMTGMGSDGTVGCLRLKNRGARVIAQDEASCVVFGMPREPIAKGLVDVVAPLNRIAAEIVRLTGKGLVQCG
jgi:two-component system, chemotaxis family, protein-glutamate methylesterase/glutaminase